MVDGDRADEAVDLPQTDEGRGVLDRGDGFALRKGGAVGDAQERAASVLSCLRWTATSLSAVLGSRSSCPSWAMILGVAGKDWATRNRFTVEYLTSFMPG